VSEGAEKISGGDEFSGKGRFSTSPKRQQRGGRLGTEKDAASLQKGGKKPRSTKRRQGISAGARAWKNSDDGAFQ